MVKPLVGLVTALKKILAPETWKGTSTLTLLWEPRDDAYAGVFLFECQYLVQAR